MGAALTIRVCEMCSVPHAHETLYRKNGHPIIRCLSCGLISSLLPPSSLIGSVYSDPYFEGGVADGYRSYGGSERVLRREFRRALKNLHRLIPLGRLLEVGSAYGYFLMEAQRYFHVEGVELSSDAVSQAEKRGIKLHQGDLLDLDLGADRFDIAVLWDTLEHLPRPKLTLERIFSLLKPGGIIQLTTGDVDSLVARLFGKHWRLMTPPQHLFYFSALTVSRLLMMAGFCDVQLEYPWKRVPLGLMGYQSLGRLGIHLPKWEWLDHIGLPLNLWDAMRVTARKPH
jgi:SAM-dependent methyltransferase